MADILRALWRGVCPFRLLAVVFAVASLPASAGAQQEPSRPIPVVTSRFLPEARALLADSGFVNVEVARTFVDDMPTGVVIRQFPTPVAPPTAVANLPPPSYPVSTEILLVVVEPLPRLPALAGWRADRAVEHVRGLPGDLIPVLDAPQLDPGQRIVTSQSVPPGPVQPPDSIALTTAPVPQEPADPPLADTVVVVDTVVVEEAVGTDANGSRWSTVQVLVGGTALALAGLGLGMVGCRTLGAGSGGGPRQPRRRSNRRSDERSDDRDPEEEGPARETDLPPFAPVIVDEIVWGSGGRVRRRSDRTKGPT